MKFDCMDKFFWVNLIRVQGGPEVTTIGWTARYLGFDIRYSGICKVLNVCLSETKLSDILARKSDLKSTLFLSSPKV